MGASLHPLVTIGISTYNRAGGYLMQALGSAVDQTYPNLEIIVSDNCSTDSTEAVVTGFDDLRIRYFKQAVNIGSTNNFNFCLSQARGAYFLLLHDDDLVDRDFISVCIDAVKGETTTGVIRTGVRLIDGTGKILSQTPNRAAGLSTGDFFLGWFSGKTAWYLCNTLYNTKALQSIGGFRSPTNRLDDCVATARLAAQAGRADVHEVKASFRRHQGNFGSTINIRDWCEDSLFLLDLMCRLAPDREASLKRQGLRFFCNLSYRQAGRSTHPLSAYLAVYRAFGYRHSPVAFLLSRSLVRWRRYLRNTVAGRPVSTGTPRG